MTTSHSRSRSMYISPDPHLSPFTRQRANSSTGGSPHSFASNIAVVAGPTAVPGQYYGVFLGEPPKGFPSSHVSSEPASPGHGHVVHHSTGASNGDAHGSDVKVSDTRPKRSSALVAFPTTSAPMKQEPTLRIRPRHTPEAFPAPATASDSGMKQQQQGPAGRSRRTSEAAPVTSVRESKTTPPYHVIRIDASTSLRAGVVPPKAPQAITTMPPSALKRQRRNTLSTYSGSSGELPAAEMRSMCKFARGAISECLKMVSSLVQFCGTCRYTDK